MDFKAIAIPLLSILAICCSSSQYQIKDFIMIGQDTVNVTDDKGRQQGVWLFFWDNGKQRARAEFSDDKPVGQAKYYDLTGDILYTEDWSNNNKDTLYHWKYFEQRESSFEGYYRQANYYLNDGSKLPLSQMEVIWDAKTWGPFYPGDDSALIQFISLYYVLKESEKGNRLPDTLHFLFKIDREGRTTTVQLSHGGFLFLANRKGRFDLLDYTSCDFLIPFMQRWYPRRSGCKSVDSFFQLFLVKNEKDNSYSIPVKSAFEEELGN
jgi:hypothetical protein